MNKLNAFRALKKIQASFTNLKLGTDFLDNGDLIEFDGETLSEGNPVYLKSASNDYSQLPEGSYKTKNSNITFTINKETGLVENLSMPKVTETPSTEPILQAQSKVDEPAKIEVKAESKVEDTPKDKNNKITEKYEVKLASADVTVDISDVINSALSPVWDAISAIQTAIDNLAMLYVSQDSFSKSEYEIAKTIELTSEKAKEIETNLSKVSETVNKIAKLPATTPIEGSVNQFSKQANTKELSKGQSRIMDIINAKD
jgi:hypothetical protein